MPPKIESGHEPGHRARQGPRQHASVPTAARLPGSLGGDVSGLLLHLQRTAGNQAVNALLRDYATSPPPAPSHTSAATDVRTARFEIDSDGDQRNDLALVIRAPAMLWDDPAVAVALGFTPVAALDMNPTPVSVEITQLSSLATRKLEFDWPSPSARLFPAVAALTDGKGPTTILLTPSAGQQLLMVYPPTTTPDGLQYRVEAAGKDATLTFPVPAEAPSGAGVAAAGVPFTADAIFGTITAIDVTLGAYGDQFRIAIAPTAPDKALLAITAPHDGESRGMAPVPIALNAPLSMRAIDTGPVSLGLDLNGDDKPDIQIFDQLEIIDQPASPYAPDNSTGGHSEDRQHKVRATGPALGTDAIFPFTVQGDVLRSDVRAIAGITALDVPLGPFGDTFRLTFQPTAPDRALFGLSPKDLSSLNEGLGTEIALNGPFSVHMIDVGPASVGLDLNGDNKPEMEIVDQVNYWEKDEAILHGDSERSHTVWATGSAIGAGHDLTFPFTVQGGRLLPGLPGHVLKDPNELGKAAAADAMAVETLAAQADQGDIVQQIDACERRLWAIRFKTESADEGEDDDGISSRGMYHALLALSSDLIALEPQINQQRTFNIRSTLARGTTGPQLQQEILAHSIDPALQGAAVAHAVALVDLIPEPDDWEETPWDAQRRLGNNMVSALKAGAWERALSSYQQMVYLLDEQMVAGLKSATDGDPAAAKEAESLVAQEHELRDVADHNPKRLLAVFLPDEKFRTEEGYVAEVPLSLYYWKEDDTGPAGLSTWHLKDQTNPEKTHDYTVFGTRDQTEPPDSLWDELNSDRFPVGVIRYQIPGGANGEVRTTSPLTFKKFLGYLGMGLAALSLVLMPFDAPVAAQVFTLSAVAAGTSAALDLAEHLKEGDLDFTTAVLDITQIVSALAGTSAMAAGRIRIAALDIATEGGANAGTAARLAAFAGKVYVALAKTAAVADAVNVATFGIQTAVQLDEIEYGPGSRADKDRAKLRLLAQLAATGGIAALHIKGLSALPGEGSLITIAPTEQGGTVVAKIAGEESATGLTSTVHPETGLPPVTGSAPAPDAPGGATPPRRPSVLIVGAERSEEFAQATSLAGQGRDVTVVNPRATAEARSYQATGGHFHEGGIETLPPGVQYDYIREEFPQPLGRTALALEAVRARFRRLAPGGRLEIVTEANAEEFRQLFDFVGESEYHCSMTTRELGPGEGPHSPNYVPAGERRIETVFARPAEPPSGAGSAPPPVPGSGQPGVDPHVAPGVGETPATAQAPGPGAPPVPGEPVGPYDPAARTDDELVQDMNRTPRPGETPDEAIARARRAGYALYHRQTMRTSQGLGAEPPILEMRAHDARYAANGAHTVERHGSDVPLRRTDAPRGIATIEGRIYGDPPWNGPENWSYRWTSPTVMNDTINTYLRANWEMIRLELAMEGRFQITFDAGNAVGEGFYNAGQMGIGAVDAVYHQTSTVSLTLQLIPGQPPSFFVVTAFPAGRGY